jgi:hypothetical protein
MYRKVSDILDQVSNIIRYTDLISELKNHKEIDLTLSFSNDPLYVKYFEDTLQSHEYEINYAADRASDLLNFDFIYANYNLDDVKQHLEEIESIEQELTSMVNAWESDEPFSMACNDPGLQFEQGEILQRLWDEFNNKYSKK